jgi:hypothetical protein
VPACADADHVHALLCRQVIADGTKSPVPVDPRTLKAGAEVVGEEDDYRWVGVGVRWALRDHSWALCLWTLLLCVWHT